MMGWMATLQIRDRCESRDLIVGPPRLELYRRSAYYVKRILDGAKPADLPVEQPTRIDRSSPPTSGRRSAGIRRVKAQG
jgi:hypothetical protein